MTEMFIDTIHIRCPARVLLALTLEYMGFTAYFELSEDTRLKLSIHAFAKDSGEELEVYEIAVISNRASRRVPTNHATSRVIKGSDPIPVLRKWLQIALGGEECSYEGSFAESILANGMQREEVRT